MNLKLILQATGQSWVLEPSHDYIAGSDRNSDIDLSAYPDVAGRHLRLSCDRISNTWYVQDLDTSVGTYIEGEAISRSLIEEFTTIKLANHIIITAEPVNASAPVSAATVVSSIPNGGRSSSYKTEDVRNNGFRDVVNKPNKSDLKVANNLNSLPEVSPDRPIDRQVIREYFECLRKRRLAKKTQEPLANQIYRNFSEWTRSKKTEEVVIPCFIALMTYMLFLNFQTSVTLTITVLILFIVFASKTTRDPILPELPVKDKQIDLWLQQDFESFGKKAREILKILTSNEGGIESQNTMVSEHPIMMLSPIESGNKRAKISYLLSWMDDKDKTSLNAESLFYEEGLDKISRGNLNDFMIIFLCRNFISYYRGSWNSTEGVLLDEVTAEFMYDCIASIKTQEYSNSWTLKDKDGTKTTAKLVHGEVLTFSTDDGGITNFEMNSDVEKYFEADYIPTAKEAAEFMRREIRQRRIDVQITQSQATY